MAFREIVLKRLDMSEPELEWLAEFHLSIRCDGFVFPTRCVPETTSSS